MELGFGDDSIVIVAVAHKKNALWLKMNFFKDEKTCAPTPIGSPCRHNEFRCSSGTQCIPKGEINFS